MKSTRRSFLTESLGAGICLTGMGRAFQSVAGVRSVGTPNLKVGILSDIHMNYQRLDEEGELLRRTLTYFSERGVDAVLMAGDLADSGYVDELEKIGEVWRSVFPKDRASDGRSVTKLFLYGNHDARGFGRGLCPWTTERNPRYIAMDRAGWWKRCFDEDYAPIYAKTVKGYTFICGHWDTVAGVAAMPEFIEKMRPKLTGTKPFFYAQHPHPKNTCSGPWAWGHDDGTSTRILSTFPNAVAFSGHSHNSLTDERVIWQGEFTSIGASSLSYSSIEYAYRENTYVTDNRHDTRPLRMKPLNTWDGKQGMLMSVYDDRIVLERHDFLYRQRLGDDWVVPVPVPPVGESPFDFKRHAAVRTAPAFAADATAAVKADVEGGAWVVTFPGAQSRSGCRVFEYEVTAVGVQEDVEMVLAQRRVLAADFHLPESGNPLGGSCIFAWKDMTNTMPVRFEVRPLECFGRKGAALVTPVVQRPAS